MTILLALACWFSPAPGYPPTTFTMQSQTPRANAVRTNGQLRRPPGG